MLIRGMHLLCDKPIFDNTIPSLFAFVCMCISGLGCVKGGEPLDLHVYKAVASSASHALPLAVEMERVYPATDHFIQNFGDLSRPTYTWTSISYFGGRYELEMFVEVEIDYDKKQIVRQVGPAEFNLHELRDIEKLGDGRYKGFNGTTFNPTEVQMKEILKAGGDYSLINVTLKGAGLKHFDSYVKAWRRDRIPVSLLKQSP